jgi:hypothetical protein
MRGVWLGVVLVAIALSGCLGLPPKPTDLHTVPIGPPPHNYEGQIRDYLKRRFSIRTQPCMSLVDPCAVGSKTTTGLRRSSGLSPHLLWLFR